MNIGDEHFSATMIDDRTLYIRYRMIRPIGTAEVRDLVESGGVERVIVDIRQNPGGDNSFSDRMISWFADRPYRFASSFSIRVSEATTASNAARISLHDDPQSMSRRLAAKLAAGLCQSVRQADRRRQWVAAAIRALGPDCAARRSRGT